MAAQAQAKRASNPWLDLVRAIAIALVLLRHGERAIGGASEGIGHNIAINGWIGVDLFLVLSGYLITRHLVGAGIGTPTFSFSRYVTLRALRIVPAYVAVMMLIIAGAFPVYRADAANLPASVAWHLLFLQDYLPANINVVFWSLGVEAKFYLAAPALVAAALCCRSAVQVLLLLAAIAALSPLARWASWMGLPTPIDYDTFFVVLRSPCHAALEPLIAGVAIAAAEHRGLLAAQAGRGLLWLSGAAAVLLAWIGSHNLLAPIGWLDATLQPVLIAALAAAMTLGAVLLRDVPMPAAAPIGVAASLAYSLYLVHFPLIPLAVTIAAGASSQTLVFWIIYLGTSTLVAYTLHHLVERRFLQLKDHLDRGGRSSSPASVRPAT